MKPGPQFKSERFPRTDFFFQAYDGRWRGYWPEDDENSRRHNLGREYLIESAREQTKEMAVLGVILFASAWPVVLMIVEIIRFYQGRH